MNSSPVFILRFPVFKLLLIFGTGVLIGITLHPWHIQVLLCPAILALSLCFGIILFFSPILFFRYWLLSVLLVYPIFFLLGIYDCIQHDPRADPLYFANRVATTLFVQVEEPPVFHLNSCKFRVKVLGLADEIHAKQPALGFILLTVRDSSFKAHYGDLLCIPNRTIDFADKRLESDFDYKGYEGLHLVFHQCLLDKDEIWCIRKGSPFLLKNIAFRFQKVCAGIISKHVLSSEAASFISAMTIGLRVSLPQDLYTSFARTGTVHIISISGMHVYIVFSLFSWLLGSLRKKKGTLALLRKSLLIAFIFFYALISGLSPAVCRCAFVIALIILSEDLRYQVPSSVLLCGSAFLLLIADPWLLVDMSFQLSYLAVAGLQLFQPKLHPLLTFDHPFFKHVWSLCSTSVSAQLLTVPVCLYYFHQFPVYFLPANLLIIPLTGIILYIGIALLFFSFIPLLSDLIAWTYCLSYKAMTFLLQFFSGLPGALVEGVYLGLASAILCFYILIALYFCLSFKSLKSLVFLVAGLVVLLCLNMSRQILHLRQKTLIFMAARNIRIICILKGNQAFIATPICPDARLYNDAIKPELNFYGIHSVYLVRKGFKSGDIQIDPSQIRVGSVTIQILTPRQNPDPVDKDADIPCVSGQTWSKKNQELTYLYLDENVPFSKWFKFCERSKPGLILGNLNSNLYIREIKERLQGNITSLASLKNNKSLVMPY